MPTLINLYETFSEALHTIQELEAVHVAPDEISLIILNGKSQSLDLTPEESKTTGMKKKTKAKPEAPVVPAEEVCLDKDLRAKFFATVRLYQLAGLGDVAAGGWIVTDVVAKTPIDDQGLESALPTGLLECLMEHGLTKEHADTYIEAIKRGGTLVGVKPQPGLEALARQIMRDDHCPLDPRMRGRHYTARHGGAPDVKKGSDRVSAMLIGGLKR